jgi:hypothetical protein
MDNPPPLHLVGPAANNPHYEKVSELRRRLGVAFSHPSTTAEQREKIIEAEAWLGYAGDEARLFIPAILLEVEKMYRPANGGSRKKRTKKRTKKRHAKRTAKRHAKRTKKQTLRK